MWYQLSNGINVGVRFNHLYGDDGYPYGTECVVEIGGEEYVGVVKCHSTDPFVRVKGRLKAFNKVLGGLREFNVLTKKERQELFKFLFPKFKCESAQEKKRKKFKNKLLGDMSIEIKLLNKILNQKKQKYQPSWADKALSFIGLKRV